MMRASILLLILAAAGCYSPGVQPCQLACSANRECPDGLACNGQNACAATSSARCDELPIDAPETDAGSTSVTIEVRDVLGDPVPAALVVFTDAAGTLVAEMPTGGDGKATTALPDGGGATVIRVIPRPPGTSGTDLDVTTYLDLWPGAHVVSQALQQKDTRTVSVSFIPPNGYTQFALHASCAASATSTTRPISVEVPLRCAMFDVILTATSTTATLPEVAAILPAQTSASLQVATADFKATRSVTGTLTNLPGGTNRALGTVSWATPSLPPPVVAPAQLAATPPFTLTHAVPTGAGVVTQLSVDIPAANGGISRQSVFDRFSPMATSFNRDYAGVIVPWLGKPTLNYVSREMTWAKIVPAGVTASAPTFVVATAVYTQTDGTGVVWRVFGAASRVVLSGNLQAVIYPDVPGTRAFEPTMVSTSVYNQVSLFQVEPLAGHEVVELFDLARTDGNFFKIPALRHLTVSTSL